MNWRRISLASVRFIVGVVFVASGLLKGIDPIGFSMKLYEYISGFVEHSARTSSLLVLVAVGICLLEFLLGAFLLMGVYRKTSSRVLFAFMVLMTGVSAYSYFFTSMSDCGCFGDAIRLTPWETFLKNLVLLPMSFLLLRYSREVLPVFSVRERLLLSVLSGVGFLVFVYSNLYYLPFVDFLPYRVGDNIKEKISLHQQEIQEEIQKNLRYVYRRRDEVREFSLNELPEHGWTFVETKGSNKGLEKNRKGYDFELFDYEGMEVSDSILSNAKGVFLLLSEDWKQADQQNIDAVGELALLAEKHGYKFWGVWPGEADAEAEWRYQTGANYPMLKMDKSTIRSIVRANPGLLVLKGGTIVDKLSLNMLPRGEDIASFVDSRLVRGERSQPAKSRVSILIIWGLSLVAGWIRFVLRGIRLGSETPKQTEIQ